LQSISPSIRGGYYRFFTQYTSQIPIIPRTEAKDTAVFVVKNVERLMSLNKQLSEIGQLKTDERSELEDEINQSVYKLYDITAHEKKTVEDSLSKTLH
jgi:hypothetical protein